MPDLAREVELAIAISRSFRKVADRMMDHAQEHLQAGRITLDEFYTISDRYQYLVHQANLITYEADRLLGQHLTGEMEQVAEVIRQLEQRFRKLQRVERVLGLSMKLFVAVGSVALAVVNPGLGTIAAATAALTEAASAVDAEAQDAGGGPAGGPPS